MAKIFHIVSNNEWGGGEQYVYDLSRRQMADGIDVELVCRPVEAVESKFKELGVAVHAMRLGGALDVVSAIKLKRLLSETEGEVFVHAHNFKDAFTAAYAKRLLGDVGRVHVVMCRHLTRPGRNKLLYPWLYRRLETICFDSCLAREVFLSTHPAIDESKLRVVHTSIVLPSEPIAHVDVRKEFGIGEGCVLAMYHGRIDVEKGIDVLIEAVGVVREKNFKLLLVGRGSSEYTAHVKSKLESSGLSDKVLLAGFRHPVLPYVAGADFGILASVVREGCPLSPLEYMSQGHPVIATNNGGQKEYLRDEVNGLLVPAGDVQALASAISRLVDDAGLRRSLGAQAKADFEASLNYEQFYQNIKQIYGSASL